MVCRWSLGLALWLAGTAGLAYAAPQNVGRRMAPQSQQFSNEAEEEEEEEEPGAILQAAAEEGFVEQEPAASPMADAYDGQDGGVLDGCVGQFNPGCCSPPRGFWGRAEVLYWWVQGMSTPALATTSPVGTPQADAGVLPGATVLFGNQAINGQGRPGARFTLGYWFDPYETIGVESTTILLQQAHASYNSGASAGNPILARPFLNAATGAQDADLIAFPNLVTGQIGVASTTKVFGTEVNFRRMIDVKQNRRTDLLLGWRFFRFDEGLEENTFSTSINPVGTVPVGTTFNIHDTFGTQNMFNGGNFGLRTEWFFNDRWSLDILAKAALGAMRETVTIQGNTVITEPNTAPVTFNGGILAQPRTLTNVGPGGNIGTYTRTRLAGIPELNVNAHYQLTRLWRVNVGYSLLYVTNAVRPGNQIDTTLDPNRFPPAGTPVSQHPVFTFQETAVWMMGVNVGVECRF